MNDYYAFTLDPGEWLHSIQTAAYVTHVLEDDVPMSGLNAWRALWDTGASRSCISREVVDSLGLKPIGKSRISTANGYIMAESYLVNVGLPNSVLVPNIHVSCSDLGLHTDMLIGMDIIRLGDFSITNVNHRTVFSFRIPSVETIDYVNGTLRQ